MLKMYRLFKPRWLVGATVGMAYHSNRFKFSSCLRYIRFNIICLYVPGGAERPVERVPPAPAPARVCVQVLREAVQEKGSL